MDNQRYDAAIVGTGPAGMSAAVNLTIRRKRFLLFGTPELSRKLTAAPRIDNYLGFPSVTGLELQASFQRHLDEMNIEIQAEQVQMIYPMGGYFSLATAQNTYEAAAVILAPGTFSARLLTGEQEFLGRGVSYCATCDAPLYKGRTVAVAGSSEDAAREAEYLAEIAGKVYYIPVENPGALPQKGVEVLGGKVLGVAGDTVVRTLELEDRSLPVDGVFILRETVAPDSLVPGIEMQGGFIKVDSDLVTNLPGCYAAGDCTGKPHQYMRAAGQGQTAALNAAAYLDKLAYNR